MEITKKVRSWFIGAAVAVIAVIILCLSITKIPMGHTGVVSTFGKVSDTVMQEGLHSKAPWQRITKIDNRIVKLEVETESSTKDMQTVATKLVVSYRIDTNMSYSIIKNIGKDYENVVVSPAVNESLKAVMAKYTAEECINERAKVSADLVAAINDKLNSQGITVNDVNITDFTFSDNFKKAIDDKQVAEQQLKKAETDKKTAIVNAQAEAEKKVIAAQAEADAIKAKADAQAEANEKLNKSLTKELVDYQQIQKWDGKLPQVSGSAGTIVDFGTVTESGN